MTAPDLDLHRAIVTKLRADATLLTLIGNPLRLYEDPPTDGAWTLAYVTVGDGQNVPDQVQGLNGAEVYAALHVWSRGSGWAECKRIADALYDALNEADLSLGGSRCVLIDHDGTNYLRDPDGKTKHAVVTFRALTEPTA